MVNTKSITLGVISDSKTINIIFTGSLILVPLLLSGPQLLVGTIVNSLLCLSAATSQRSTWWLKAAVPSLAAVTHGVLFGPFSASILYLWPFITLGNFIYMSLSQQHLLLASLSKGIVLTVGAIIMFQLKLVPSTIVYAMGLIQLVTGVAGGLVALIILKKTSTHD